MVMRVESSMAPPSMPSSSTKDNIKARLESVMAPPPSSATNMKAPKQWEEVEVS